MRRPQGWNAAVAVSGIVALVVALATGIGWLASRASRTTTYSLTGRISRVDLELSSGQAVIVGSSSSMVQVRRTDAYSFGHLAQEQRSMVGGVLHIRSRCPRIVVGSCSASYELSVPESVAVHVHTNHGDIGVTGFSGDASVATRSGNVDVEAYCGFSLSAVSGTGNLHVATACAPQHVDLRTASGDAVLLVPPGRYRIGASSGQGSPRINGVVRDPTAPFTINARSSTGSVTVQGGL